MDPIAEERRLSDLLLKSEDCQLEALAEVHEEYVSFPYFSIMKQKKILQREALRQNRYGLRLRKAKLNHSRVPVIYINDDDEEGESERERLTRQSIERLIDWKN